MGSIPKHRCRVVRHPYGGKGYHVVQIAPSGKRCGISKKYFSHIPYTQRSSWGDGLTWEEALEICRKANLDRFDSIFGVQRKEVG